MTDLILERTIQHRALIEAALAHSDGGYSYDDIVQGIEQQQFVAWPGLRSILVCQLVQMPRRKVGHCFLAAGEMKELMALHTWAEEWARREGCDTVTINGRPGWERVLASDGYRKTTVVLEKQL